MANFLLVYYGGGMPATDEERDKVMAAWGEWMKQCGDSRIAPSRNE